jgi:hypothetical protein
MEKFHHRFQQQQTCQVSAPIMATTHGTSAVAGNAGNCDMIESFWQHASTVNSMLNAALLLQTQPPPRMYRTSEPHNNNVI